MEKFGGVSMTNDRLIFDPSMSAECVVLDGDFPEDDPPTSASEWQPIPAVIQVKEGVISILRYDSLRKGYMSEHTAMLAHIAEVEVGRPFQEFSKKKYVKAFWFGVGIIGAGLAYFAMAEGLPTRQNLLYFVIAIVVIFFVSFFRDLYYQRVTAIPFTRFEFVSERGDDFCIYIEPERESEMKQFLERTGLRVRA